MILLPSAVLTFYAVTAFLMTVFAAGGMYGIAAFFPLVWMGLALSGLGPSTFLIGMGLLAAAFVGRVAKLSGRSFAALLVFLLGAAQLLHHLQASEDVEEMRELRRRFPVASIRSRLAFHERPAQLQPTGNTVRAKEVRASGVRAWKLEWLHSQHYEEFVSAAGFGAMRMPHVRIGSIQLPPLTRLATTPEGVCFDLNDRPGRRLPEPALLTSAFRRDLGDFLNVERLGYYESVDRVIGFEPHAMSERPSPIQVETETWQVARLELVSLLRHDAPRVYMSGELPNLEELDRFETRELDEFEQWALGKLQDQHEIATTEEPSMIRLLGAVRAAESCIACHDVPVKSLLGAFSYEIRPVLTHSESVSPPDAR
jgi:hypothetical protein